MDVAENEVCMMVQLFQSISTKISLTSQCYHKFVRFCFHCLLDKYRRKIKVTGIMYIVFQIVEVQ